MPTDLDRQIDRAIRSMLDVEPPRGLRARVLASLEPPERPHVHVLRWAAVAAAATVTLVVVTRAPWRATPAPIVSSAQVHDVRLPAAIAPAAPHVSAGAAEARPATSHEPTGHLATVVAASDPVADAGLTALERPAALSVTTIPPPATSTLPSIQPAPLRVSALELPALEMPPGAARGTER